MVTGLLDVCRSLVAFGECHAHYVANKSPRIQSILGAMEWCIGSLGRAMEQFFFVGPLQTQPCPRHQLRSNVPFGPNPIGGFDHADYGVCAMAEVQTVSHSKSPEVALYSFVDFRPIA